MEPGNACKARPETGTLLLWPPRGRAQAVVLLPSPQSHPAPRPPVLRGGLAALREEVAAGQGHGHRFRLHGGGGPI